MEVVKNENLHVVDETEAEVIEPGAKEEIIEDEIVESVNEDAEIVENSNDIPVAEGDIAVDESEGPAFAECLLYNRADIVTLLTLLDNAEIRGGKMAALIGRVYETLDSQGTPVRVPVQAPQDDSVVM